MAEAARHRFYGELAVWWPLISPPVRGGGSRSGQAARLRVHPGPRCPRARQRRRAQRRSSQEAVRDDPGGLGRPDAGRLASTQPRVRAPSGRHAHSPAGPHLRRSLHPRCRGLHDDRGGSETGRRDRVRALPPGGVVVFVPDCITETFQPGSDYGGTDGADERGVRYLEWSWDPDPVDTQTVTQYAFLLRESDGSVRVEHEMHEVGLFPRDLWLQVLVDAGLEPEEVTEQTTEDRTPRAMFVGHRFLHARRHPNPSGTDELS